LLAPPDPGAYSPPGPPSRNVDDSRPHFRRHPLPRPPDPRRAERARERKRIAFLDPDWTIPRTGLTVRDAREGKFEGGVIPRDLERQWIQGTGPGAKPHAPLRSSLRNMAYALLSGADGWMFDGEDALGQVSTMSLDNQRNLKLALARDPVFLEVAEEVAAGMNDWAEGFLRYRTIRDWPASVR
jgi:malate synthase